MFNESAKPKSCVKTSLAWSRSRPLHTARRFKSHRHCSALTVCDVSLYIFNFLKKFCFVCFRCGAMVAWIGPPMRHTMQISRRFTPIRTMYGRPLFQSPIRKYMYKNSVYKAMVLGKFGCGDQNNNCFLHQLNKVSTSTVYTMV